MYQPIIFNGYHPLTGAHVQFVFNEPAPGRKNILIYYYPENCWYYSEDAGLSSGRVEAKDIEPFLYKADVMVGSSWTSQKRIDSIEQRIRNLESRFQ